MVQEELMGTRAAVNGWFKMDDAPPRLIGTQCLSCDSYYFPPQITSCHNPNCTTDAFKHVELSRRGRLWSYTNACYQPPPPFISPTETFQPFAIAAVELDREKMVILGQVTHSVEVEQLHVGMEMELIVETLFEDDDGPVVVYKWAPIPEKP